MAESTAQSPLARLVLFLICLAIAGSIVAGVLSLTTERPVQNLQRAPENSASNWDCTDQCQADYRGCLVFSPYPIGHCKKEYDDCLGRCH